MVSTSGPSSLPSTLHLTFLHCLARPSQSTCHSRMSPHLSPPFTITRDPSTPVEFTVHNGNNFMLYDVQIHDFFTASVPLILSGVEGIDKLAPNENQTISAMIATDPEFDETGTSFLSWTVLARDEAGRLMQSTMFQRDIKVTGIDEKEGQDKITVEVNVGGEPQQGEVQSGMGSSLMTRY